MNLLGIAILLNDPLPAQNNAIRIGNGPHCLIKHGCEQWPVTPHPDELGERSECPFPGVYDQLQVGEEMTADEELLNRDDSQRRVRITVYHDPERFGRVLHRHDFYLGMVLLEIFFIEEALFDRHRFSVKVSEVPDS